MSSGESFLERLNRISDQAVDGVRPEQSNDDILAHLVPLAIAGAKRAMISAAEKGARSHMFVSAANRDASLDIAEALRNKVAAYFINRGFTVVEFESDHGLEPLSDIVNGEDVRDASIELGPIAIFFCANISWATPPPELDVAFPTSESA